MKQFIGIFEKVDIGEDNYHISLINSKKDLRSDGDLCVYIIDSVLYVYRVGESTEFVFAKSGDYQIKVKQLNYEKKS